MAWQNITGITTRAFTCGFCSNLVAGNHGFYNGDGSRIHICPHCEEPNNFNLYNNQIPSPPPGNAVGHLPEALNALYTEARNCVSVCAYTVSVLACRKLLMNIAVEQGAPEGKHFIEYVEFLSDAGFVPPNGKGWVDHIRRKGNEATHEIALMSQEEAEQLISFAEMLIKFIFEFPNKIPPTPEAVPPAD